MICTQSALLQKESPTQHRKFKGLYKFNFTCTGGLCGLSAVWFFALGASQLPVVR